MIAILYVCHANMCRSPALEAFLQKWIDSHKKTSSYYVDSCGLNPGHVLDDKTIEAAKLKGVYLCHRPRPLELLDFSVFDYILAATEEIKDLLISMSLESKDKIYLATHFSKLYQGLDLPDPYSIGREGFSSLMAMVEESTYTFFKYLDELYMKPQQSR